MAAPEKRVRNGKVRWYARYRDPEGKQRSKVFDRQVDAQRFLDETVVSVRRGTYLDPDAGRETFRAHAETWLEMQTFNASTRETVAHRLAKHVYPVLGDKELGRIKPSTVKAWLAGLAVAPSYARVLHANVSSILAAAVEDEKIAKNPARTRASRPGRVHARKVVPWTAEQVANARAALPESYRILVTLGAGLGLRQGELLALSPDDVDFLRGTVHVRRQVKLFAGNKQVFAPPKGDKERDVPLPHYVRDELAKHLVSHPAVTVTLPWKHPQGEPVTVPLITTSREHRAINRNHFNGYQWAKAVGAARLDDRQEEGMHQLRHFYASVLLDAGESIKAVASYLGHSDPGFTLRTYTHLMPSSEDRTRKAVDAALRGTAASAEDAV